MVRDINLFFNPESKEYIIVSEGHYLKLNKADFKAIKKSMNGLSYALRRECKRRLGDKSLKA